MPETVVLLPGLQSDHTSWTYQIEHLQDRYDVTVPTGYHAKGSIVEMADCIIDQLPPRFHFVAWSMGGYIALQMLPKIRERLISFVLISTSAQPEDSANTQRRLENLATAEQEGMAAANERSLAFSCLDVEKLSASQRAAIKRSAVELGTDAYRAQQHAIIKRPDGRDNLPIVSCPTLVIVGDSDEVTPPDRAMEIHDGIPTSELVVINNCGHCPPLEYPARVNNLLDNWFSRHPEHSVRLKTQGAEN